jgi:hypothetical protein
MTEQLRPPVVYCFQRGSEKDLAVGPEGAKQTNYGRRENHGETELENINNLLLRLYFGQSIQALDGVRKPGSDTTVINPAEIEAERESLRLRNERRKKQL